MSGTFLYVVDMQEGFTASSVIIEEVMKEIRLAHRRLDPVIFVELNAKHNGNTLSRLRKANVNYPHFHSITKSWSDGSGEFLNLWKSLNSPIHAVRVCGVNRHACVYETVRGFVNLSERGLFPAKIEVAGLATAEIWAAGPYKKWGEGYTDFDYFQMYRNKQIRLLLGDQYEIYQNWLSSQDPDQVQHS